MNFGEQIWVDQQSGHNCDMIVHCVGGSVECHSVILLTRLTAIKSICAKLVQRIKIIGKSDESVGVKRHVFVLEPIEVFEKVLEFIYRDVVVIDGMKMACQQVMPAFAKLGMEIDGIGIKKVANGIELYRVPLDEPVRKFQGLTIVENRGTFGNFVFD